MPRRIHSYQLYNLYTDTLIARFDDENLARRMAVKMNDIVQAFRYVVIYPL